MSQQPNDFETSLNALLAATTDLPVEVQEAIHQISVQRMLWESTIGRDLKANPRPFRAALANVDGMLVSAITEILRLAEQNQQLEESLASAESELDELRIDQRTSLLSQDAGSKQLEESFDYLRENPHIEGYLLFIDMNGLKALNDKSGHDAGDMLLEAMGAAVTKGFRANMKPNRRATDNKRRSDKEPAAADPKDVAFWPAKDKSGKELATRTGIRFGGDEVVVLVLEDPENAKGLSPERIAQRLNVVAKNARRRLVDLLGEDNLMDTGVKNVSFGVGMTKVRRVLKENGIEREDPHGDLESVEQVLKRADKQCTEAKDFAREKLASTKVSGRIVQAPSVIYADPQMGLCPQGEPVPLARFSLCTGGRSANAHDINN